MGCGGLMYLEIKTALTLMGRINEQNNTRNFHKLMLSAEKQNIY
jgi:hypothetical protein